MDESERVKNILKAPQQERIHFYRTDLLQKEKQPAKCSLGNVIGYKKPLVLLTQKAFMNPDSYYNMKYVTGEDVGKIEAYLQGTSKENEFGIKQSILNTVRTFYKLYKEIIKTLAERGEFSEYSSYSYIGTEDGVMIIDGRLPDTYDHQVRGWYRDSMRHKGDLTLSLPYVGAASMEWLLTLSTALFASKTAGSMTGHQQVLCVAGVSILPNQMLYQLTQAYPECEETNTYTCMIINDNGRIVMHTDLIKDPGALKRFAGKHITEKEYDIARILIQREVMKNDTCFNSKTTKNQHFWKIDMSGYLTNLIVSDEVIFQMTKVSRTNVYIIIKKAWHTGGTRCDCNVRQDISKTPECNLKDPCECPCHNITRFDICANNFSPDHLRDASFPCFPDQPKVNFANIIEEQKKITPFLNPCHVPECERKPFRWLCGGTFSCSWCNDKCAPSKTCQVPTPPLTKESSKGIDWKIFIYILIAAIIMVIIPIVMVCGKRQWQLRRPMEQFVNPAYETESMRNSPAYNSISSKDVVYGTPPQIPEPTLLAANVSIMVGQTAAIVIDVNPHKNMTRC